MRTLILALLVAALPLAAGAEPGAFQGAGVLIAKAPLRLKTPAGTFQLDTRHLSIVLPPDGTRVWVSGAHAKGVVRLNVIHVLGDRSHLPTARGRALEVSFDQAEAWIDMMPRVGPAKGQAPRFLLVRTRLTNRDVGAPLDVQLAGAWLSTDPDALGKATALSLRGADGRPTGKTQLSLAKGATRDVQWRADAFDARAGQTVHVLLLLKAGDDWLMVRRAAKVEAAH